MTKGVTKLVRYVVILVVVLLVFPTACSQEQKPQGLLPQDEMVGLLVEMYLAEARVNVLRITKDSAYKIFPPFEQAVLERRGITDSTLKANYAYYLQRPEELEKLLDAVIDTLSLREQRAE